MKRVDEELLHGARRVAIEAAHGAENGEMVAVAAAEAAVRLVVTDLHAMLHPDKYPGYDPDHMFWDQDPKPSGVFEWSADTIEWVADWTTTLLRELGPA